MDLVFNYESIKPQFFHGHLPIRFGTKKSTWNKVGAQNRYLMRGSPGDAMHSTRVAN